MTLSPKLSLSFSESWGDRRCAQTSSLKADGFAGAYPPLFRCGLLGGDGLGPLQAAARALDQQGAQVRIAMAGDLIQPGMPAAECWVGTRPSHADICRPCLNSPALPTVATMVSAVIGPHLRPRNLANVLDAATPIASQSNPTLCSPRSEPAEF
jgi:hypothetical protein